MITNSPGEGSSSLYRVCRGRKPEDPLHSFPFPCPEAAFLPGPDKSLFLLLLEASSSLNLRVFHLARAEGYRGQEGQWSRAPSLKLGPGPTVQALNCAQAKWQIPGASADIL